MKNALLLIIGVGIGCLAAYQLGKMPAGRGFIDEVDRKAREFRDAVVDGYKAREAELRAAVADVDDVIAELRDK